MQELVTIYKFYLDKNTTNLHPDVKADIEVTETRVPNPFDGQIIKVNGSWYIVKKTQKILDYDNSLRIIQILIKPYKR